MAEANVPRLCLERLYHFFEHQEEEEVNPSDSPLPQLDVTISLILNFCYRCIPFRPDHYTHPLGALKTLRFDLHLLTADPATASQNLRGLLHELFQEIHLQIFLDENSAEFDPLIHDIVQFSLDRMKKTNVASWVLPVFATVGGTVVQYVEEDSYNQIISQVDDDDDDDFLESSQVEDIDHMEDSSISDDDEILQYDDQFEEISSNNNHGMVPADESSIHNMLLNNKVIISPQLEEISDHQQDCCVVCLEQLGEVGSQVSQMPCSHQFHTACIQTWLNNSHYCPVCRYVMPLLKT